MIDVVLVGDPSRYSPEAAKQCRRALGGVTTLTRLVGWDASESR
jgi:hypothetical protein